MEERSKAAAAAGTPIALAVQMFGPEPNLVHIRRHATLSDIEAYGQKNQADPAYRAAIAKIRDCLDRDQTVDLEDMLVPAQPTGPANYALRIKYVPAMGKMREMRQLLEQRAGMPIKGAVGVGLSTQVAPQSGPNFSAVVLFSSLEGYEEFRGEVQREPSIGAFQAQMAALSGAPPSQELYSIAVPFPMPA
jgi:hypothetical protein